MEPASEKSCFQAHKQLLDDDFDRQNKEVEPFFGRLNEEKPGSESATRTSFASRHGS